MRRALTTPQFHTWRMSDGYSIQGRVWNLPEAKDARAAGPVCLYFHGIQSHGAWFEWSGSLLAAGGASVIMPDRRGSGLNREGRGDAPSIQRWLDDIAELAEWAKHRTGAAELRLVGVSWGGKLAAMHALRNPTQVERVLLITPGIFPAVDVGFSQRMRIAAALLKGGTASFEIPLSDPALFTDNPAGQEFISADPLKLTHATARFLWHSTRLDRALRRAADRAMQPPVTLLLAGRDRIIRNAPLEAWCRRVCGEHLRIERFAADVHTLEFARDTSAFENALRAWVG